MRREERDPVEGSAVTRPIGERVAAAEEQLEVIDRELARVRDRLHELEADRATIRLLLDQMSRMSARVEEVASSVEDVAKRTAEQVVGIFYSDKTQLDEVRKERRRDRVKVALQALAIGISLGSLLVLIILR